MNAFERRIALRVVGVHAGIIVVLLLTSLMKGCFKPKPKEIVTFIEFGAPAAAVSVQQVSKMPEPAAPTPAPAPASKPAPIPEPVKPKPRPQPTPKPKPTPKPAEPKKPKWTPTKASDIDPSKAKKVNEAPNKPALSSADISEALEGIASQGSSGAPSQFNAYIASIGIYFRRYWTPPPSASPASGVAVVRISMLKNGQITKRVKIQSSGDANYDKTVMDAVNAVSTVPRPPTNFPRDYVEVEFEIGN